MPFLDALMFWRRRENLGNPLYALNLSYDSSAGIIPIDISEVTGMYIYTDKRYLLRGSAEGLPPKEGKIDASTVIESEGDFSFFYELDDAHHLAVGNPDKLRALRCEPGVKELLEQRQADLIGCVKKGAEELARGELIKNKP